MVALVQNELKNVVSSACSKKWTQAVGVHVGNATNVYDPRSLFSATQAVATKA